MPTPPTAAPPGRRSPRRRSTIRRTWTTRQAFTLVELLVVLGIIAVLVGLLAPALAGVRRDSRKTVCKAQLQQIGHALLIYRNNNKDRYPRAPALPSVNPNNYPTLMEHLAPHLANDLRVFRCPGDEAVYPAEQTSYFYYHEAGERPVQKTFLWTVYKGDVTRIPILWDADDFHGGGVPFNWLFLDGHVDQHLKPDTGGAGGS